MKKLLYYADGIVLLGGALGMLLRLWLLMGGTDEKGLYPANHISMILLTILSVAIIAALWLMTWQAGNNRSYHSNFTASLPGAIGAAAAAFGISYTAITMLGQGDILSTLLGVIGLVSGPLLLHTAWCRLKGDRPVYASYLLPCLFFGLRVFFMGRELGAEPEASRYLLRFLASIALIPACYQLWGFAIHEGSRQKCLFWNLTAAYLCIIAVPGSEEWPLYLTAAMWLLTDLPSLKYLPRRRRAQMPEEAQAPAPEPVTEAEEPPAAPVLEEAAAPEAENIPVPEKKAAEFDADFDPDQFLADLLKEIDSKIQ